MANTKTASATKTTNGKKPVAGSTGNRYTEEFKREVVKEVEANGSRGAITEAMEKHGISYIALRSWIAKFGKDAKPTEAKKLGRKPKGSKTEATNDETIDFAKGFKSLFTKMEGDIDAARNAANQLFTKLEVSLKEMRSIFNVSA